jgi:hypothetical protein
VRGCRSSETAGRRIAGVLERRRWRRIRFALLIVGLLSACSDSGTVTNDARLQQAPSSGSKVLATIPRGSAITVGDCTNGWCRALWNRQDGYVLTKTVHLSERWFRTMPQPDQSPEENDADESNVAPADEAVSPSGAN